MNYNGGTHILQGECIDIKFLLVIKYVSVTTRIWHKNCNWLHGLKMPNSEVTGNIRKPLQWWTDSLFRVLIQTNFKEPSFHTSMWIPCFIDINSLVPVKYITNEHRWGKDAVIATYSQYGKGGVFPNGQIQRPWRIPSRTWWEVQDMNNIQGRKHHESLSLKRCIINFNVRATTGITVEQWRSGLCGRVRAACRKEKYNWQWLQRWQENKYLMDDYRCIIKRLKWNREEKHSSFPL